MVKAGSEALSQSGDPFRGPTVAGTGQVSLWFPLKVLGDPGFFHFYPHSWPSCVRPVLQHQHCYFYSLLSSVNTLCGGWEGWLWREGAPGVLKAIEWARWEADGAVSLSQGPLPRVLA